MHTEDPGDLESTLELCRDVLATLSNPALVTMALMMEFPSLPDRCDRGIALLKTEDDRVLDLALLLTAKAMVLALFEQKNDKAQVIWNMIVDLHATHGIESKFLAITYDCQRRVAERLGDAEASRTFQEKARDVAKRLQS